MKKSLFVAISVVLTTSVSVAGPIYTLSKGDLLSMLETSDKPAGNSGDLQVHPGGFYPSGSSEALNSVGFRTSLYPMTQAVNPDYPWASISIGFSPGSVPVGDLSSYTDFALELGNRDDDNCSVKLYIQTGWTNSPYNEASTLTESGWAKLLPGENVTIALGLAGVPYPDHVTDIGFIIGCDFDDSPGNPGPYDWFHVSAAPIPEPASLAIMGFGLLALLKRRN